MSLPLSQFRILEIFNSKTAGFNHVTLASAAVPINEKTMSPDNVLYNRQDSKNTITDSYENLTIENIFLFTLRYNLN